MITRWTPIASHDFEIVCDYIAQDNADKACDVANRIYSAIEAPARHPEVGRIGRRPRTRELILPPYVVVYRVEDSAILVLNVFHSARRPPIML
jgi:toxin ParE1/3/4